MIDFPREVPMTAVLKMPQLKPLDPIPEFSDLTPEEQDTWRWMTEKTTFDSVLVNLTPRLARLLLERVGQNRKVSVGTVQKYARAMASNQWRLTHQGIAISRLGEVIDGQHRLRAVIETQSTIEILCVRGVPQDSVLQLDGGRLRTDADAIRVSDIALGDLERIEVTSAKRMMRGVRRSMRPASREDLRAFILRHRAPIQFVSRSLWQHGRIPNVTHSEVVAVLARAYYHCSRDELIAALDFFTTGKGDGDRFEPLLTLREWLLKTKPGELTTRYGKTSRAMRAFIARDKLGRGLHEAREELFPLPEERPDEEVK